MTVTLDRNVEEFIGVPRQLFIDGRWVDAASGRTFETPNPATGETLARIAEGGAEDINRAVKAARRAFEEGPWSRMTPSERGRIIWRIGDLILAHLDELAQLESLDNGKPFAVAQAADVPLAADLFHYMAGWATKIEGNSIDISVPYMPGANFHSYTLREPVGVVGQIIPWNFPLLMAAWKLGPALTTGNCVVLKPAEQTSEYGLGAGIWTRDISKAHTLAKKLRAGTVWINCYNVFDAALPFGGYKQSGWGREMGHEVLNSYTEVKAVTTLL
jgi:phenylacetaldehyde dehydrogenase